jgi:hypothetical protein
MIKGYPYATATVEFAAIAGVIVPTAQSLYALLNRNQQLERVNSR